MNRFIRVLLIIVFAGSGLTAAFSAMAAGGGKPLAKTVDMSGATFTVGSKEFTEQLILGQITLQLLRAAGANVKDETGLAGSNAVRKALTLKAMQHLNSEVDVKGKFPEPVAQQFLADHHFIAQ